MQNAEKTKIITAQENIYNNLHHTKTMKFSKENFGWIFACGVLAILLALAIYLGFSGWYFENDRNFTTDLQLGKTVQVGVDKNGANAVSFNLDGSFLAGERLPQLVAVKNLDEEEDVALRAKIFIYSGSNQTLAMNMVETLNWQYNENDGYFYFNSLLTPQNKVALCSYIFIDEETTLYTDTKYIVTIVVEALASTQDIENIWGINPFQND